jgi:hypothetical protein
MKRRSASSAPKRSPTHDQVHMPPLPPLWRRPGHRRVPATAQLHAPAERIRILQLRRPYRRRTDSGTACAGIAPHTKRPSPSEHSCVRTRHKRTHSLQTNPRCMPYRSARTEGRQPCTSHRIAGRQRVCPTSSSISHSRRRKPKASLPRPPPISIIHPLPAGTANMHGISAGAGCNEPAHQDLGLDVCSLHVRIQARGERTF